MLSGRLAGVVVSVLALVACGGTVVFEEDGGDVREATSGAGASGQLTAQEICKLSCACYRCDSVDEINCATDTQNAMDEAAGKGCDDELAAYHACFFGPDSQCIDSTIYPLNCDDDLDAYDDCLLQ